jgi:hypothetical protein
MSFSSTDPKGETVHQLRKRLTYANVVSTLCLFLLLGGGAAFAATKLGKNSVGTKQLKARSVTGAKIKKEAVTAAQVKAGSLTGANIAGGSIGTANLADGSVNSAKVLDGSLTGKDVAPNSLTGTNINASTLGEVPEAAKLAGNAPSAFTSSAIYKNESPLEEGTNLGDGTFAIEESCNPGDVLLDGGPADVNATSSMVESFPAPGTTNAWKARIRPNPAPDNFLVVVLCAKQG